MTLPQIYRLFDYWKEHPPVNVWAARIAALLGFKNPPSPYETAGDPAASDLKPKVTDAAAIIAMAPHGFLRSDMLREGSG